MTSTDRSSPTPTRSVPPLSSFNKPVTCDPVLPLDTSRDVPYIDCTGTTTPEKGHPMKETRYKVWVIIERQELNDDREDDCIDISAPVDVGPPTGYETLTAAADVFLTLTGEHPEWMVENP